MWCTAASTTRHRCASTSDVVAQLEKLIPLAPLHQPHNLAPIRIAARAHAGAAAGRLLRYRVPPHAIRRWRSCSRCRVDSLTRGVRRYGFHGLSYEYIASVLPQFDARAAQGRTVVAPPRQRREHVRASQAGASVASTMGFTALDGLPMGTRCGALDPGVMLYLMDERRMDARAIEKLLYHQSGLLGVSGISSDMRTLLASSEPRARARDRPLCLSHSARARLARRRARRAGRDRVHRRHWRKRGRDPRTGVPRCGLARR